MKQTLRYDQLSCRLQVEGLPDVSAGQTAGAVGIITGWSLQWLGRPELEGQRDHLIALMVVVLPYARHLLSGVPRRFGGASAAVTIEPQEGDGHRLTLRSSQDEQATLSLSLDDAELADLVRVLDGVRLDPRLVLPLELPEPQPLRARDLAERLPLQRRLAAPLGGLAAVGLVALVSLVVPPPPEPRPPAPSPSLGARR
ncbi:MAG: DUF4335 domain-containing protein [Cyanobium sp.]